MTDGSLWLRHIHNRNLAIRTPRHVIVATRKGMTIEAASKEDYEWLLSLKIKSCNCGGARPGGSGNPVFEAISAP